MRTLIVPVLLSALVSACSGSTSGGETPRAAASATPIPASAGTSQSCLELSRIRESKVVDDRTIDFVLRDGTVLRNSLPFACSQLGFERAFSYSTSISRLCSTDIITVINQGGGIRTGASCGLGQFVPQAAAASTTGG